MVEIYVKKSRFISIKLTIMAAVPLWIRLSTVVEDGDTLKIDDRWKG